VCADPSWSRVTPLHSPDLTQADVAEHLLAIWCHLAYALQTENDLARLLTVGGPLTHLRRGGRREGGRGRCTCLCVCARHTLCHAVWHLRDNGREDQLLSARHVWVLGDTLLCCSMWHLACSGWLLCVGDSGLCRATQVCVISKQQCCTTETHFLGVGACPSCSIAGWSLATAATSTSTLALLLGTHNLHRCAPHNYTQQERHTCTPAFILASALSCSPSHSHCQ
jgi:hypothetical protein